MHKPIPLTRDLVLIGGGHAHALLLKAWGMNPLPGARVTLIDPRPVAAYTGMLPGYVAGHYARDDLDIDLVRLARFASARLLIGNAAELDTVAGTVQVEGHGKIEFDVASLNTGATIRHPDLPGFADHCVPVRPLANLASAWASWTNHARSDAPVVILGAGVGGVELAFAIAHQRPKAAVKIVEAQTPLSGVSARTRRILLRRLDQFGIEVVEGHPVSVDALGVTLRSGVSIASEFTVAATGARASGWLDGSDLTLTDGFVQIDPYLKSTSHENVFAVGDCAQMVGYPRPKAGVFAVRQAPFLLRNLKAALGAGSMKAYRPQERYLKLISLGQKSAVADRAMLPASGAWVWRMKDRIDRKFMHRLSDFPPMAVAPLPSDVATGVTSIHEDQPLCGGCGAKVGSGALNLGLAQVPTVHRADVELTAGDDAATLLIGGTRQAISTDHLRSFALDPALVSKTAAVHALGDIHAMGADPQAALATIILPEMSEDLQKRWLSEIMRAVGSVFEPLGVSIVGGHTTQGAELTIGFTLTGTLPNAPITLSGAAAGDHLILTKPIGSGTVLAGEMAMVAKGQDIANLWSTLVQDQGAAAKILNVAHAMTDVTGFGLAGHLFNICNASGTAATIWVDEIPTFAGAIGLAERGIRSSLFKTNFFNFSKMTTGLKDTAAHHLLFDPQTAGGLLAAVPAEASQQCLDDLTNAGFTAAIVGEIHKREPGITLSDRAARQGD